MGKVNEIAPARRELGRRAEPREDARPLRRHGLAGDPSGEVGSGDADTKGRSDLGARRRSHDHLGVAGIPAEAILHGGQDPCMEGPSPEAPGPEDEPDPAHARTVPDGDPKSSMDTLRPRPPRAGTASSSPDPGP